MEQMEPIDDTEIQEKVESLVGKGTKVVDCEKSTSFQTQEVLLVNGFPVPLNGEEGARIKKALMEGQVPPGDLLNEILIRAGILKAPVELETTMNVKSTTKTTELLTLRDKNGIVVDERMKEVEEDNEVNSTSTEVWRKEDKKNEEELRRLGKRVERINLKNTPPSSPSSSPPKDEEENDRNYGGSYASGRGGFNKRSHNLSSSSSSSSSSIPSQSYQAGNLNGDMARPKTPASASTTAAFTKFAQEMLSSSPIPPEELLSPSLTSEKSPRSPRPPSQPPPPPINTSQTSSSSSPGHTIQNEYGLPPTISAVNGSSSTCSSNGSPLCTAAAVAVAVGASSACVASVQVQGAQGGSSSVGAGASSSDGNPYPSNSLSTHTPLRCVGGPSVVTSANDWDHGLVYQNANVGTLAAGTLEALIEHLIPTETYYPEKSYVFAFVLSSRLFLPPHQLLGHVFHQLISTPTHSPKYKLTPRESNVPHMVRLLGEWTELFPYDFRDEQMMAHVRNITQKCVAINPPIRKEVSLLLTSLLARLTALEKYEDFLHRINTEAALGDPLTCPLLVTICPSPSILAQQLTYIELERLSHIGPEEFVQAFAKDSNQMDSGYKEIKKTRNLECYVQWFNRLSYLVATEICKVPKKKNRVRQVEFWIECARESFNIGNFNSLMAIIAGLNMAPIGRLKKTWSKVCSLSQLAVLESQMEPSANFSSYRSTLKAAVWRSVGATDERQRIVIPFFSLLVKDLYFLNEGCASKLPNGYVNFEKIWQFAKQVTEVIAWQIPSPFPKVQPVLDALNTAPVFSENALCLASYECESADNSQEKERLKYLRKEEASSSEVSDSSPKKKHFKKTKKVLNTSATASGSGGGSGGASTSVTASTSSSSPQEHEEYRVQPTDYHHHHQHDLFNECSRILENPELETLHQIDLSPA